MKLKYKIFTILTLLLTIIFFAKENILNLINQHSCYLYSFEKLKIIFDSVYFRTNHTPRNIDFISYKGSIGTEIEFVKNQFAMPEVVLKEEDILLEVDGYKALDRIKLQMQTIEQFKSIYKITDNFRNDCNNFF